MPYSWEICLLDQQDPNYNKNFADDKNIDFHIFNAGEFNAPLPIESLTSTASV